MEVDAISYKVFNEGKEIGGANKSLEIYSDTALIEYVTREELQIEIIDKPRYMGYYQGRLTFDVAVEDII